MKILISMSGLSIYGEAQVVVRSSNFDIQEGYALCFLYLHGELNAVMYIVEMIEEYQTELGEREEEEGLGDSDY